MFECQREFFSTMCKSKFQCNAQFMAMIAELFNAFPGHFAGIKIAEMVRMFFVEFNVGFKYIPTANFFLISVFLVSKFNYIPFPVTKNAVIVTFFMPATGFCFIKCMFYLSFPVCITCIFFLLLLFSFLFSFAVSTALP